MGVPQFHSSSLPHQRQNGTIMGISGSHPLPQFHLFHVSGDLDTLRHINPLWPRAFISSASACAASSGAGAGAARALPARADARAADRPWGERRRAMPLKKSLSTKKYKNLASRPMKSWQKAQVGRKSNVRFGFGFSVGLGVVAWLVPFVRGFPTKQPKP